MKLRNDSQAPGQAATANQSAISDAERLIRWRSLCADRIHFLCMGGKHYAAARYKGAEQSWLETVAAIVEPHRMRVAEIVGIPAAKWYPLAEAAKNNREVIAFLISKHVIPRRPDSASTVERRRTQDESEAAADALADELVGPRC